ncbi:MAG: phospholipase D family protein [Rickettsiaceae bacterium]|nr:phospholipase D family protein [Rickettsiaceae bacterium]
MPNKKIKIKKSDINHILRFFSFSKAPIRSIVAILFLGISLGIAYEEMVGIGTWHSFHPKTERLNVCFTPPSGCGSLIAQEISKANETIFVQAYGLTSNAIIHQLKSAKDRGVAVHVLIDGGNLSDNQSVYQELMNDGIDVSFDKMPGIAHNKVIIIDKKKVITGSFNFTSAADTKNAENVLLIEDTSIALQYLKNWDQRYKANINKTLNIN